MTLSQFVEKNSDILPRQISSSDLETITVGTPLFVVSLAGGNKPQKERTIVSASYGVAVFVHHCGNGQFHSVDVLALTRNGYAKIVNIGDVETHSYAVFQAKPLPAGDIRTHFTINKFE